MEFRRIRALRGPNIWSRKPALEAWVDLGDLKDTPSNSVPGFVDRLMAWLPSLIEHRCSVGERGGFLKRLQDGTYPAHILEHVTLELQTLSGTPVGFGKARETAEEGVYRVVVRYKEEPVARAALVVARELILAAMNDRPFDLAAELTKLKDLVEDVALGPSTTAIVNAAEARGIPTRRLNTGSLVQLGQGAKQRRIWTAETDCTSAIAETIAQDKDLTKQLLRSAGVPVPDGAAVQNVEEAWAAAQDIGLPVVVKPRDGNHGRGVFINLHTEEQVRAAYEAAKSEGSGVLVERCAPGYEHRLLVVGDAMVAAARGDWAFVTGDGTHSVQELVELQINSDPRRGESHSSPLAKIEMDTPTRLLLSNQGTTPEGVPPDGAQVLIQRNGNLRIDVTDEVHPSTRAHVVMAAKIVGLDIAGVDVVTQDISKPLEEQGGVIVELNASPGLHAHLMPGVGKPRPAGEAIIATLFPEGQNGRIPIVAITGTNGKTTVAQLVHHLLRSVGRHSGLACSDGIWIDERAIERGDCGGPRSARKVLTHPRVETAVLEAGRGGILREGLGFDKCDVAVVTNIGSADHLGQGNVQTPDDMFTVKRCPVDVVFPHGASVLNATDPLVADMARLSDGPVTFFAIDPENPVVSAHCATGRKAVYVRAGRVTLADGPNEIFVAELAALPVSQGGRAPFQVENLLAATGAAWALGLSVEQIRDGLASFAGAPGRFATFAHQGGLVIVDDSHNPSALEAVVASLDRFPQQRRTIAYSAGARRRDADVVRQGELLGRHFDRVIVYEDSSATDRDEGELTALFRRGLAMGTRVREVLEIRDHRVAVETAVRQARPGELVVVQAEDASTEPALELVREFVGAHE